MRRHAPKDAKLYGKIQSSDYLVPDTKQEEAYQRSFTPTMRNRRRLYIWFMYGVLGIVVCLVILFVLYCCKKIEKTRVKWTKKQLDQIQEHCEASNTDTICILNAGNDTCTQVGGDGACEYIADHDSNLVMAWVIWTGTSMVLCWAAAFLVLWQPASASAPPCTSGHIPASEAVCCNENVDGVPCMPVWRDGGPSHTSLVVDCDGDVMPCDADSDCPAHQW